MLRCRRLTALPRFPRIPVRSGYGFRGAAVRDRLLAAASVLGLVFLAFVGGMAASYLNLAPYRKLVGAWNSAKDLLGEPDRLMPAVHDFTGVRVHDRAAMAPGTTFITSYFPEADWNAAARLIDAEGTILHTWRIDAEAVFGRNLNNPYIHGAHLFPDGEILVSYEFVGLARVSPCGEPRWTLTDPVTHHSVADAGDGTFWVSGNRVLDSSEGRSEAVMNTLGFPLYEDLLVHVGADGNVLQTISTIDLLERNGLNDAVVRSGFPLKGDIHHLNDVEPLPPQLAAEYPSFAAGDLAVSLRDLHMVMVVDPATLLVKWHTTTDTLSQHDVDYLGDGWIGVFDNRYDGTERGTVLGGSRIAAVRPHTGERKILFPTAASPPFYTKWSGKWQRLANGNLLLTEARAGRALEVDAEGRPVWEWVIEHFNASEIPEVMEATRYPITPAEAAGWRCD